MARFPFNVFLFHTYVAIFKINSFCQTYLSNTSGLQLSVMISDQRYKPEASSTWPLYDPFMQRQPGENLKQIKVTLEFFRRILISVFSSRLSLHSRLILHNLTLSLKAAESSMFVTTWSQIRNRKPPDWVRDLARSPECAKSLWRRWRGRISASGSTTSHSCLSLSYNTTNPCILP